MKWFKHMSDASNDDKIMRLEEEFGLVGYAAYFKILELCASNWDEISDPKFTFPLSRIRQKLRLRSTQVELLLNFCSTLNLFQITKDELEVTFVIDKLPKIKKKFQKKDQIATNQHPSNVPPNKSKEKEKEKDTPIVPLECVGENFEKNREPKKLAREELGPCIEAWRETLNYFNIVRDPLFDEAPIARAVLRYGVERVCRALTGPRFEQKKENYDPSKFVKISRYLSADKFDWFENLASQENKTKRKGTLKWKD